MGRAVVVGGVDVGWWGDGVCAVVVGGCWDCV
jgi:hypothetical protein